MWALAALLFGGRQTETAVAAPVALRVESEPEPMPPTRSARLPARGDTAAIRCLNTYAHLSPDDDSDESIRQWLAYLGEPDTDPAMIRAEFQALGWWQRPTPVAAVEAPVAQSATACAVSAEPVPRESRAVLVPLCPTLTPRAAAERFLEWVALTGRGGQYSSAELRALYLEHCKAEDLTPLEDNILRPEMKALGAGKVRVDVYVPTRSGDSRRHRHYHWTLPGDVSAPWEDLPKRKAA